MKRSLTSTSHLLGLLLARAETIVGRVFREGEYPVLDEALAQRDTLLLFPRSEAFELPTSHGNGRSDCSTSNAQVQLRHYVQRAWALKAAEKRAAELFPAPSALVVAPQAADVHSAGNTVKYARREIARQRRKAVDDYLRQEEQQQTDYAEQVGCSDQDRFLIVLDGTWTEVSRLLNQNERLKTWPVCIKLPEEVRTCHSRPCTLVCTQNHHS
jgi:hypothetical protein